jgi:hypothetical protein
MRGVLVSVALAAALVAGPVTAEMRLVPAATKFRIKMPPKKKVVTTAVRKGKRVRVVREEPRPVVNPEFCTSDGACQIKWQLVADDIAAAGFASRFREDYKPVGSLRPIIDVGPTRGPFDGSRWSIQVLFTNGVSDELWLYAPAQTSFVPTKKEAKAGVAPEGLQAFATAMAAKWNMRFPVPEGSFETRMEVDKLSQPRLYRRVPLDDYVLMGGRQRFRASLAKWKSSLDALPSFIRETDPKALPQAASGG